MRTKITTMPKCAGEYQIEKHICYTVVSGLYIHEDFLRLSKAAAEKYRAPTGELEVNSIATEQNYTG